MTASRAQAISARAPFRRGGLFFSAARQAVAIPDDHRLVDVLAILREPVLAIQVDNDGDGVFVTMKPDAREAAIAHVVDVLADTPDYLASERGWLPARNTPEEPKQDGPAGDPAGGDGDAIRGHEGIVILDELAGSTTTEPPTPLEAAIDATVQADATTVVTVDPASQPAALAAVAPPASTAPPAVEPVTATPPKPPKAPKAPRAAKPADPAAAQ